MKRGLATILAIVFATIPLRGWAQIYPPKPGVAMPDAYFERVREDKKAFQFERAWIQKAERIRKNREAYIAERGFYNRQLLAPGQKKELAVTGTVQVPVFMVKYANTGADPYPISNLQTKLFNGPYSPQTLSQFYSEISYGDINMTGTVYGWVLLPNNDTYYEGGCQGLCGSANVDQLIISALNAYDGSVDFGIYDNDGPDGIPNSGDDDGYVDFAAFVQPETGGECGTSNIWSHRWVLSGWGGLPWVSNDPAAGGGFIRVNDYVIQPAWNCGGATVIDIGVFCHEFGHAFGLPDLYDTNGGSEGVGEWDLMGSGSWNTVTQPAHMGAWCKHELGWSSLVDVGTPLAPYMVPNAEFNRTAYRLNVTHERWRRMTDCSISGSYSMRCGLTAAEAAARAWTAGEGYGNSWDETVTKTFGYDGTNPVTLTYDYNYDSESSYDYTYGQIDVAGTVSTFATYDGTGSGTANIDLTPYLNGSGVSQYTVSFRFQSDIAWSDVDYDGVNYLFQSTCGSFRLDNVGLSGGGESYFTDFETREDGWSADMSDPAEYFLVENRQATGSDIAVAGGGGLSIWHVDEAVIHSTWGNTGGASGNQPHGVAYQQADGLFQLDNGVNRGDAGDPYPGSSSNTLFNQLSTPNSTGYNGQGTNVVLQLTSGNGDPISANMSGSWPVPTHSSHNPVVEDNDKVVSIDIFGAGFVKGAGVNLIDGGTNLSASSVDWQGKDKIVAAVDINGAPGGDYDVVVTNPGGGSVADVDGFTINDVASGVGDTPAAPDKFALRQNYPNPFNPTTTIPFDIKSSVHVTLKVYNLRGQLVRTLIDRPLGARSHTVVWDGTNDAGHTVSSGVYFYKLVAGDFQDVRKLVLMK